MCRARRPLRDCRHVHDARARCPPRLAGARRAGGHRQGRRDPRAGEGKRGTQQEGGAEEEEAVGKERGRRPGRSVRR
jgi:hypothetical protein